jgi:site-specific DNA-methyltransferase (cytosine-N4-specific)
MDNLELFFGDNRDILPTLPEDSVDCVLTSPPYWGLRTYGEQATSIWGGSDDCEHDFIDNEEIVRMNKMKWKEGNKIMKEADLHEYKKRGDSTCRCGAWKGELGLEPTWQLYIKHMVEISSLLKRVLKPTGSYYLVMGDTYAGSGCGSQRGWGDSKRQKVMGTMKDPSPQSRATDDGITKPKQLLLIPSRLAIALQEDGWTLRNKIIWFKPNHMPSSVKDRLTNSYEEIFHFVQNRKYYYDLDSIREPHKEISKRRAMRGVGDDGKYVASEHLPLGVHTHTMSQPREYQGYENMEEKIATGQTPLDPKGKNPSDFFKSNTKPYPEAHFAVFPEDICIPRIKSSCPKEICSSCGKARERIIEKETTPWTHNGQDVRAFPVEGRTGNPQSSESLHRNGGGVYYQGKTIGWTKCDCNADFEPGVVLDPFAGTGTTGKVALDLGRKVILIEINKNYRELIERRLSIHNPIWKEKYAISDAKDNGIIPLTEFMSW